MTRIVDRGMTDAELMNRVRAIEARLKAATSPGEWERTKTGYRIGAIVHHATHTTSADCDLIAAAPADLRDLCTVIREILGEGPA